nr:MAG TPA: hypothetical protein [Bacteriophage sp.]
MKNTTLPFIKTTDEETMNKLKDLGFQMVDCSSGVWTFINDTDTKLSFDTSKITYSNKLCF